MSVYQKPDILILQVKHCSDMWQVLDPWSSCPIGFNFCPYLVLPCHMTSVGVSIAPG